MSFGYSNTNTQSFLSTDGLTQKGFVKLTTSSGAADTVARENPLCSAKIMAIESSGYENDNLDKKNVIRVDEIDIFMEDADDEYIIYMAGEYNTSNQISGLSPYSSTALGYRHSVKLANVDKDNDLAELVVTSASGHIELSLIHI